MTAPSTPLHGLTWQEFLDLPEDPALRHAELINGEVVVTAPSDLHQQVVGFLITHVNNWIWGGSNRGEATMDPAVQITIDRGYLPDIAWYHQEQCAPPGERRAFDGPPTLVVEVLSPSTRTLDMVRKRNDYARVGVRELWLIDPEIPQALVARTPDDGTHLVDVADLDGDGELCSPHLPGFAVRLGELVER
jgi:Uma2 family endonuclease